MRACDSSFYINRDSDSSKWYTKSLISQSEFLLPVMSKLQIVVNIEIIVCIPAHFSSHFRLISCFEYLPREDFRAYLWKQLGWVSALLFYCYHKNTLDWTIHSEKKVVLSYFWRLSNPVSRSGIWWGSFCCVIALEILSNDERDWISSSLCSSFSKAILLVMGTRLYDISAQLLPSGPPASDSNSYNCWLIY